MKLTHLLSDLSHISGPSGIEDAVADYIAEELKDCSDDIARDAMGNLIVRKKCGIDSAPVYVISAHMDEIGLVVTGSEDGFLRFASVGGVDKRLLCGAEVKILTDPPMYGVIDTIAPHLLPLGETDRAIEIDDLFIDVGLSEKETAGRIPPGTEAVFISSFERLGTDYLCGKAFDNRACVAIAIQAFRRLTQMPLACDLICLFTTQEELGCRGAAVGAYSLNPDAVFVLDVTFAKTPDTSEIRCACGNGVAIGVGANMNRELTRELICLAENKKINYQVEVVPGGHSGTDAFAIQVAGEGIRTALLSLPIRYMHSPIETAAIKDFSASEDLLVEFICKKGGVDND